MPKVANSSLLALLLGALAACENPEPIGLADAGIDARSGECRADLIACGVAELGWNAWCRDGVVALDDLTTSYFCEPGATTPVCQTGGTGESLIVGTCVGGCRDNDVRYYETAEEYNEFNPRDFCLEPFVDGGLGGIDAAVVIEIDAGVPVDASFGE